jgi:heme-degrading monooxygenase HmoA
MADNFMRITWGKIKPGQWQGYEEAYKKGTALTRDAQGLKGRWLVQDLDDPDSGYSITLWDNEQDMRGYRNNPVFQEKVLPLVRPFFVDQYETRFCRVKATDKG